MNTQVTSYSRKVSKVKALPVTLLFLVWPFALLLTSLKSFNAPGAKKGFILFCAYFGFVFVISKDLGGADSARYARMLSDMHQLTPSFENLWASLYSYETSYVDIYQPLLTWIVSLFTANPHYLFAIFALVFGYFYANNLWIILDRLKGRINAINFIFILAFMLIIPIWYINGVRMYTAAQIFIYGALLFLYEDNRKGLIWAAGSILVHFSFLFPVALLLIYILLPKKLPLYLVFFIVTIFVSEVNLFTVRSNLSFLPEIFQDRVNSYTNDDYAYGIEKVAKEVVWYVSYSGIALKISLYSLLIFTIINSRRFIKKDKNLFFLLCFTLFFYGWANLAALVPSGGRFLSVANMLSVATLLFYYSKYRLNLPLKIVRIVTLPLIIFYCIFSIRVGFDFMGISTFIGNPIFALIFEDNTPLIEFVKSFL